MCCTSMRYFSPTPGKCSSKHNQTAAPLSSFFYKQLGHNSALYRWRPIRTGRTGCVFSGRLLNVQCSSVTHMWSTCARRRLHVTQFIIHSLATGAAASTTVADSIKWNQTDWYERLVRPSCQVPVSQTGVSCLCFWMVMWSPAANVNQQKWECFILWGEWLEVGCECGTFEVKFMLATY